MIKSGWISFWINSPPWLKNVVRKESTSAWKLRDFDFWHLQEALQTFQLEGVEIQLFTINPALIKAFKKSYPSLPKTDHIDAWVIADRLRFGRLTPLHQGSLIYAPLARLTRLRYTMKNNIQKDKNRAINLTFLKFSNYRQAAGRKSFHKSSCELLEEFTPVDIADKPLEELIQFVHTHGNNRFANPEQFA
jgi:transposase